MSRDYTGTQYGVPRADVKEEVTQLGLDYHLMTQFTSFVAVEEMTITDGGQPRRVDVPVEMPEGVSHDGVFGKEETEVVAVSNAQALKASPSAPQPSQVNVAPPPPPKPTNAPTSISGGVAGGIGSGDGTGAGPGRGYGGVARTKRGEATKDRRDTDEAQRQLSPAEQKRQQLLARLHPALVAVVERLQKKKSTPTAAEAGFVRDGKAEVQIFLTTKSDAVMAKLKQLGVEVIAEPKASKLILGRIALDKLAALAEVAEVRYVAPQTQ